MDWTTLVDASTLAAELQNPELRLVDARAALGDADAGRRAFAESHLPGAVHADLNRDLADLSRTGEGRHPLPDSEQFAGWLGHVGIAPQHQVVVYDAGDGSMAAARLWWMLRLLGHAHVAVLDGGLAAWRAAGLPESPLLAAAAPEAPYPAHFDTDAVVDADEVLRRSNSAQAGIIDARAVERFRGEVEPIDPVAGHVPGARNRPFALNLRDGQFKPAEELRAELLEVLDGVPPQQAVLMCGSGVTACHLLLAFEHAGLHGARVYAGSWSGWISDPSRPIERSSNA